MTTHDDQKRVAAFLEANDLHASPEYRVLDLVSEVGELAKDVNESTGYGSNPYEVAINEDEIGDTLFALLALCEGLDVNATTALETALEKYEGRIAESGEPSSG